MSRARFNKIWAKIFAVLVVVVMNGVSIVGSKLVAKFADCHRLFMLGILVIFAVVTLADMNSSLLAPSGYPLFRDTISGVTLTFFASSASGIITFTAKDLRNPPVTPAAQGVEGDLLEEEPRWPWPPSPRSARPDTPSAGDAQSTGRLNHASTSGVRYVNRSGRGTDDGR